MNTIAHPWDVQARAGRRVARLGMAVVAGLAAAAVIASSAAASSYLSLEIGNRWIYTREPSGHSWNVEEVRVTAVSTFGSNKLFTVENYLFGFVPPTVLLFDTALGETAELGPEGETGIWYPWPALRPSTEVAVALPAFVPDCVHGSSGTMVLGDSFEVPAGAFEDVAMITYDTLPCADSAVLSEVMAPRVGLIRREVLTFRGLETWSLVYAQVEGKEYGRKGAPARSEDPAGRGGREALAMSSTTWGAIKATMKP